jgi:ATP-dependent exoDNAse (exonuclease V) beta subunit
MSPLVDQPARDLIRNALDRALVVEAAAGTGKTTELVRRIINLLASGVTQVNNIVAVTFTDKAAGELKLRLRAGLDREREGEPPNTGRYHNIEVALAQLEQARIGTIHGFCADILHERPVEAGIDPEATSMNDSEAERLHSNTFSLWLQNALANPPDGVRRSLRRASDDGPIERLRSAGWELCRSRMYPRAWTRRTWTREAAIDQLISEVAQFGQLTSHPSDPRHPLYWATAPARDFVAQTQARERTQLRDYDGLESALVTLAHARDFCTPSRGRGDTYSQQSTRTQVLLAHAALVADLNAFADEADADLAALLQNELRATVDEYEARKQKLGRLDFVDLLLRTCELIRDNQEVRRDLQARFTHLFVDEFQDTDALQAEILLLLSANSLTVNNWRAVAPVPGKLFIVGDPKQSIFRFRGADVAVYSEVKDLLVSHGATVLPLRTSFRSDPAIQHVINAAFAPVMTGDTQTLQAAYVPLAPYRTHYADQPNVVVLSVPRPFSNSGNITQGAIDASLPDAVAAFIEWLLRDSHWTVMERGSTQRVAVSARHICLLFKRFENYGEDVAKTYTDALQARGIAHALVGGKAYHGREEVGTIRTALTAIEWPDDELSVFATLRGSFLAIPDDLLLLYRTQYHRLHPFRIPDALSEEMRPIAEALQLLARLHRGRNYRPFAATVHELLEQTRAAAGFVLRPSGEQVLANVLHVAELARTYEAASGLSFRGFVEQLITDAERGEAPEAPIFEEGAEGVRLTTVHRAKGLEFPVVIVVDITAKLAMRHASRFVDAAQGLCAVRLAGWAPRELLDHEQDEIARDRAEGERLAYVAATRARDLLVVPAVGDDGTGRGPQNSFDWWVAPLYGAIYPTAERRRNPLPAAKCPEFGNDSAIRDVGVPGPGGDNVRPGCHELGATDAPYSVVWWDPLTLSLEREQQFGIRENELLYGAADAVVNADEERYRKWRERRDRAVEVGARPTLPVETVTNLVVSGGGTDCDVEVVEIARDPQRPTGARFGSLVHATIASIPLDADVAIEAAARLHARVLGAPDSEVIAVVSVIARALNHALLADARIAASIGGCRRECPVTLMQEDGTLVEGVVDLAYKHNGRWVIIDFKTDADLREELPRYRRQLGLYKAAVTTATGEEAVPYLLSL